ncbi:MAG: hypothetical protein OXF41_22040 [bacterium]|nr:hypothetical protein [bacterium]
MASLRTEISEIVTGLAMLGIECLDEALDARPREMLNVAGRHFNQLKDARAAGEQHQLFEDAWENGRAFASSADGLKDRVPERVEWKGNQNPPGYEQIPVDLRVDYVFLISCKYRSNVLYNVSPAHLFDRLLANRRGDGTDWYLEAAPTEYQELYRACRKHFGSGDLPSTLDRLTSTDRLRLKGRFERTWPPDIAGPYRRFCAAVSSASATRWQRALGTDRLAREEMLWRLLRLQAAPYFILGTASAGQPVRFRVGTPWDFRQRYGFRAFEAEPDTSAGQPVVRWWAELMDRTSGTPRRVDGHVEVRWSHGRFSGAPEAKVYLDTSHALTPGYSPLRCVDETSSQLSLL